MWKTVQANFQRKTGYNLIDLTFDNFVQYLHTPTDPASLGVVRMLYGIMMVLDGPEERGGAEMDFRWGDPRGCHFPLVPLKVLSLPYMAILYAIMWLGALGIALGYKFKKSALMFTIIYWYIILLDKSFWNNHSYLFGLIGILLIGTEANNFLSLDAYFDKSKSGKLVPYWNYFILKYQFFILYFVAGLKKSDEEWLSGYAMTNLSSHWVFNPFKTFLSVEQIDYFLVHWFAFVFDLTVCFWMMYKYTRPVAMGFCALFHLMNSRLFRIGMFPWVCLATMPLFCLPNWPKTSAKYIESVLRKFKGFCVKNFTLIKGNVSTIAEKSDNAFPENGSDEKTVANCEKDVSNEKVTNDKEADELERNKKNKLKLNGQNIYKKQKFVAYSVIMYMGLQAFLPYSHFITKGYNNWTNGLYGYSWDMMVNTWDTILILVKVVDNESKSEMFLDPEAWTQNDRWSKHGDMIRQYAQCIHRNLMEEMDEKMKKPMMIGNDNDGTPGIIGSRNISIYIDVWCSMNGRFQQRMFDPNRDLLKVEWSPFSDVEWLMPMLTELSYWRKTMVDIQNHVYTWNNYSNVLFVADFPELYLENYITPDLSNVTLTVLEGQVLYKIVKRDTKKKSPEKNKHIRLVKGESTFVQPGVFHRIHIIGNSPACYMYTFMNATLKKLEEDRGRVKMEEDSQKLPLLEELWSKFTNMMTFWQHVGNAILYMTYGVPMLRRVEMP